MNNIQETSSKKTRGGARKGAGRPRTIAKQITIGIPQDALEIFQQQPNLIQFFLTEVEEYALFIFQTKMRNSACRQKQRNQLVVKYDVV